MSLINDLKKSDKKGIFTSNNVYDTYSTGFLPLDYLTAFWLTYEENGVKKKKLMKGLMGGKFITIIGYSGTGKTTLADQMAWSICNSYPDDASEETIRKFKENALMVHVDIEQTAIASRITNITGASKTDMENRIILDTEHLYIEDVMGMIDSICKAKEENPSEYMYDIDGAPFGLEKRAKVYVPTVFIIDSLPAFTSSNVNAETLEGDMSTNRDVKQISQFYMKLLGRINKYNITVIAINHIKSAIQINPYEPEKKQLMLVKKGESLPRGQAPAFYSMYYFRLDASGSKANMKSKDDDGYQGFIAYCQLAKTKSSFIGGVVPLVFNSENGYDPILTLLAFAMENHLYSGTRAGMTINGASAYKFKAKEFKTKFLEDEGFRLAIVNALTPALESLVGSVDETGDGKGGFLPLNKLIGVNENGDMYARQLLDTGEGSVIISSES